MLTSKLLITLIVVAGSIFASNGFWDWLKTRRHIMTPFERMTMAITRDRVNFLSKRHLKDGYIPEDEFESFKEMGESYIDGGGNSKVKELFEEAMKLPKKWDLD